MLVYSVGKTGTTSLLKSVLGFNPDSTLCSYPSPNCATNTFCWACRENPLSTVISTAEAPLVFFMASTSAAGIVKLKVDIYATPIGFRIPPDLF